MDLTSATSTKHEPAPASKCRASIHFLRRGEDLCRPGICKPRLPPNRDSHLTTAYRETLRSGRDEDIRCLAFGHNSIAVACYRSCTSRGNSCAEPSRIAH